MVTAMMAWDIQRASKGRFMLGLGTQVRAHNERRLSCPSDAPAARVKEFIQCIRAIWNTFQNGAEPEFKGQFYQFTLITPFFHSGPIGHPEIPIYLAGVQPLMCRTAGEVADGLHVHPMHSVKTLKELVHPSIAGGARKSGRNAADVELFTPVFAVTGKSREERSQREKEIRDQISFYASTPNYRDVLAVHGWEAVGEELSRLARAGEWDRMGSRITDEMLDAFAISVPEPDLPRALRKRYEGVVHRVALYHPISEDESTALWENF